MKLVRFPYRLPYKPESGNVEMNTAICKCSFRKFGYFDGEKNELRLLAQTNPRYQGVSGSPHFH